jgi:hypothetical protein
VARWLFVVAGWLFMAAGQQVIWIQANTEYFVQKIHYSLQYEVLTICHIIRIHLNHCCPVIAIFYSSGKTKANSHQCRLLESDAGCATIQTSYDQG